MKVEAEVKEMYKIIVGDNGMCMGQYYSEDDWEESYYGETIEKISELLNVIHHKGLPRGKFYLELWKVLTYEDKIYDYELIAEYSRYSKDTQLLDKFNSLWNSEEYKNIRQKLNDADKMQEERNKKLAEIEYKKKQEQKEFEEYQKLKDKYEK